MPLVWLIASLFPLGRVWGINLWAVFPTTFIILLTLVTLAAGLDENLLRSRIERYPQLKEYMAVVLRQSDNVL